MIERVVITDALYQFDGKFALNPALAAWEKPLLMMKQQWQSDVPLATPLSWFASSENRRSSSLLASVVDDLPTNGKQYWVASPYHAKLTRSSLRVMPESMLDWSAREADRVCNLLQPLLAEEGMSLHVVGSALLLVCDRVWDVVPEDFAVVAGDTLPDRLPAGEDSGHWMRLISEIQMTLHQHPMQTAQGIDIHGLWFWHGEEKVVVKHDWKNSKMVATQDAYLKSVLQVMDKEREATMIISASNQLPLLLKEGGYMPKEWLLLGEKHAVRVTSSMLRACMSLIRRPVWRGV